MIVLGIDPGSILCGYAVLHPDPHGRRGHKPAIKEAGVLRPPSAATVLERIESIVAEFGELLAEHQPDVVAIETAFVGQHARPAIVLCHVRGAILGLLSCRPGVTSPRLICEPTPGQAKRAMTGKTNATKETVQRAVMWEFGLSEPPQPVDVSDAVAVAMFGWVYSKNARAA